MAASIINKLGKTIAKIKALKFPPFPRKTEWRATCRDTPKDKWEVYTFTTREMRDQFIADCHSRWPSAIAEPDGD